MKQRSALECAALASAVAPHLCLVGVGGRLQSVQRQCPIDTTTLADERGHLFDVHVGGERARRRLKRRAENGALVARAFEKARLDISVDAPLACGGTRDESNHRVFVVVSPHQDGVPVAFQDLTEEECRSLGTAIGRVHAVGQSFLTREGVHGFSGPQVRAQLAAWSRSLSRRQGVPDQITSRWQQLVHVGDLWQFRPVVCHGGYRPDDILFSPDSTVAAIRDWEGLGLCDPARDFSWLFDEGVRQWQRDDILTGYGEVLGEKMDSRIIPRARLWRQLTAVRDLLLAKEAGDPDRLARARRLVNAIASSLSPLITVGAGRSVTAVAGSGSGRTATKAEKPLDRSAHGTSGRNSSAPEDDETRKTALAAQQAGGGNDGEGSRGTLPSRLSQLDDGTVASGENLTFTGTGQEHRPRMATNTNMPSLERDGTRTTLAKPADTRRKNSAREAKTKPFETKAYLDTNAPDATVRVTHSSTVRERLFPDDRGEDLFATGESPKGSERKNRMDPNPHAGPRARPAGKAPSNARTSPKGESPAGRDRNTEDGKETRNDGR